MNETAAPFTELLVAGDVKACCASLYENQAVRWLLDDQLHPGGDALTLRTAELAGIGSQDRALDVASGTGRSAMLLAREFACPVVGVDYGAKAVSLASATAAEGGLKDRVKFVRGDVESLPFKDHSFDIVLCECSLCTFPDKPAAVAELRRVLRPGGTVAISDVTAEPEQLPLLLRSAVAQFACVADALPANGYEALLSNVGFEIVASEAHDAELEEMARMVEARLRVARMLNSPELEPFRSTIDMGIELAVLARHSVSQGLLGYRIFVAHAADG